MSIRFYRRIPIIPKLLYLNIGKNGISFSFGVRGAHVTVGKQKRVTVGIPGTGLSYSKVIKNRKNISQSTDERGYQCPYCDKITKTEHGLKRHIKAKHP